MAGNGAVGLWVATALADAGARVTIVGPAARRGAASAAAGAMLGCFGEVTRNTLASGVGRQRFELQLAAHRRWPDELDDLAAYVQRPILVAPDTYVVLNALGGTLDSDNLAAMEQALQVHGVPYDVVDEAPGLAPTPTARPLRILHLTGEGAVHSARLLQALQARAVAREIRVVDSAVRSLRVAGQAVTGVILGDGAELAADHVVVAAGAWTSPLLDGLPGPPVQPVFAGSGVAYVAERVKGRGLSSAVRTVTRAGSCGLHALPLGDGFEYFGATNVIFGEPEQRPHLGVCQFLAGCAIDQIDREVSFSRIEELRIGNRPVPFDTFPLLGPGPVSGLWVTTGGYRDGLHAAPEVAALTARSLGEGHSCFPEAFTPTRRPISTLSVKASIDDFVEQQVGSAFEGGLTFTPFLGTADLDRSFRPLGERLYDRLGATEGLAPDLVTFLAVTRKSEADVDRAAAYLRSVAA